MTKTLILASAFFSGIGALTATTAHAQANRETPKETILKCELAYNTDWIANVTLTDHEITSIAFSNVSGTVASDPLAVSRSEKQSLPGFVFYQVAANQPYEMRVEEELLQTSYGRIYFESPYLELPPDVYFCKPTGSF